MTKPLQKLNAEQARALELATRAIKNRATEFHVRGLAGTGKTEVLRHLAQRHPDIPVAAYTNRAARMLEEKIGRRTTTVHSLVKRHNGYDESGNPLFKDKDYFG